MLWDPSDGYFCCHTGHQHGITELKKRYIACKHSQVSQATGAGNWHPVFISVISVHWSKRQTVAPSEWQKKKRGPADCHKPISPQLPDSSQAGGVMTVPEAVSSTAGSPPLRAVTAIKT